MSHHPLITTIIPTYQRPDKLRRAILSVLDQTYPHLQVCIYDNASGDETPDVVQGIAATDSRVRYVRHSSTIDAVENFQSGLSRVSTDYFSFLGDDDLLLPTCYEAAIRKLEHHPKAYCCIGSAIDVEEGTGCVLDIPLARWADKELFPPSEGLHSVLKHYVNWCGTLFRKEVISALGPLNPSIKTFDFEFLVRLASRLPLVISKEPAALFVHHEHSYSGRRLPKLYWPGWGQMFDDLQQVPTLSLRDREVALNLLAKRLHRHLFSAALQHLKSGHFCHATMAADLLQERFPKHWHRTLGILIQCAEKAPLLHGLLSRLIRVGEVVYKKIVTKTFLGKQKIYQKNVCLDNLSPSEER